MIVLNDSDNDDETIGFISKSKKKNSAELCVNIQKILVLFSCILLVYTFLVTNCYYTMNPPPMNPPPMNPPPMNPPPMNPPPMYPPPMYPLYQVYMSPHPPLIDINPGPYPPLMNTYQDLLSSYPPPPNVYQVE